MRKSHAWECPSHSNKKDIREVAHVTFTLFCAVGNFSADDILLNGGTVTEIIPVPDTYEYFVWVQVTSGIASLHIAINPGAPLQI